MFFYFAFKFYISFVNRKCANGSVRMPNAIILVTNFATEKRATSRVLKCYFAAIRVTDSAVKFAHLNVRLVLSSKCLRKTRQPGTCHLIKYFHSEVTILFDLDTSTWSVNTGSKWKKWTNGFIIATVKRRLPESNARLVQHAPSLSNCVSVTGTGSNPFTLT